MRETCAAREAAACPRPASARTPAIDRHEIGRRLGFDLCAHGRRPDLAAWPTDVREGYRHACAEGRRSHLPDRHERKWLQLRLQAHRRDRVFDEAITPDWLRKIDVDRCPVTRLPLTHALRAPTDASIDRANNDGAYARSNLAVMSTLVNQAKGARGFDEVMALARAGSATDGLQPVEWLRLAGLMLGPCHAARPELAPLIPLVGLVPKGLALTAMQQTQHGFAFHCGSSCGKNLLVRQFRLACRTEAARQRLARLADIAHDAAKGLEYACDIWLRPAAMEALERWRDALDDAAWNLVGEIGRSLAGTHRVEAERLSAWQLPTLGYRAA